MAKIEQIKELIEIALNQAKRIRVTGKHLKKFSTDFMGLSTSQLKVLLIPTGGCLLFFIIIFITSIFVKLTMVQAILTLVLLPMLYIFLTCFAVLREKNLDQDSMDDIVFHFDDSISPNDLENNAILDLDDISTERGEEVIERVEIESSRKSG